MEKLTVFAILMFVLLPFFSETASYQPHFSHYKFTLVIDAGHGGKDSGALGSKVKEKDVALKLALKLGAYVNRYLPDVRVLYTRTTDEFIPLHQRISVANQNNADVFFSIHCNSMLSKPSAVQGTETYVMGLHRAEENLNVAKRENKAVLLEQDYTNYYNGYDPNSSEGHIMLSMYQNAYLAQSLLLAGKVEKQFKNNVKRKSRGVKQAGFLVLRAATMPSILVEAGFLSNSTEEAYLNSERGQVYMASAMYRAFKEYKEDVQKRTNFNYQAVAGTGATTHTTTSSKSYHMAPTTSSKQAPAVYRKPTPALPKVKQQQPQVIEGPSIEDMYPTNSTAKKSNQGVIFRVQLAASPSPTNLTTRPWNTMAGVECLKVGGSYKCLVGKHQRLSDAVQQQSYWRKNGFKDAFVVAFKNGQKISMAEATTK